MPLPVMATHPKTAKGREHADVDAFRKVVGRALREAHCAMQTRRSVPLGVFLDRKEWTKLERVLEELGELTAPERVQG